jgi:hypothetical protein
MLGLSAQQLIDVPLLIPALLEERRWPNLKPQLQAILPGIQIPFVAQQIQPKESIVSPALAHLKIRYKLPLDNFMAILMNHLDSILIPINNKTTI